MSATEITPRKYYDRCVINCNIEFTDDKLSLVLFYIKLCLRCSLETLEERYNFGKGKKNESFMSKILYVPEIRGSNKITSVTLYFISKVPDEVKGKIINDASSLEGCVKELLKSQIVQKIVDNCGRGRKK
ncbi:hypothetical protein [Acidianus sp. RZ1]|uniref:type III-G CRISPR-associated protein Csx26 n=1 Tax=Acidianus sp. RZ1 TaxID=1540082 RepID=UPI001491424C|nr:hypothetical protein [Acidianus sp. RZ1]NON61297.1 hypothetical protein [Acidianus sp. RZ1]